MHRRQRLGDQTPDSGSGRASGRGYTELLQAEQPPNEMNRELNGQMKEEKRKERRSQVRLPNATSRGPVDACRTG